MFAFLSILMVVNWLMKSILVFPFMLKSPLNQSKILESFGLLASGLFLNGSARKIRPASFNWLSSIAGSYAVFSSCGQLLEAQTIAKCIRGSFIFRRRLCSMSLRLILFPPIEKKFLSHTVFTKITESFGFKSLMLLTG